MARKFLLVKNDQIFSKSESDIDPLYIKKMELDGFRFIDINDAVYQEPVSAFRVGPSDQIIIDPIESDRFKQRELRRDREQTEKRAALETLRDLDPDSIVDPSTVMDAVKLLVKALK